MAHEDRRHNVRVRFATRATLVFPDRTYPDLATRNLSIKGLLVLGAVGPRVGDQCDVTLFLSGTTSELTVRVKGVVARVEGDNLGVSFREIDLDSFFHLKNIVYFNAEDPDQVDQELFSRQRPAGGSA
ncbi:MAG: PilZ domain-containing protein [Thermodesulfobacteriota bacterium]